MNTFISFWQHIPEHLNPVALTLGPFRVHWYGLMYVVVFTIVYLVVHYRLKTETFSCSIDDATDLLMWCVGGVIIGGRLGYVFFYDFAYYMAHPLAIISPFDFSDGVRFIGIYGMSYHGGLIGVIIAFYLFARRYHHRFWHLVNLFIPAVPLGYTFGRIGNFINGELYGRSTTMPWGMYFPHDVSGALRHPSQLYEAFFEGLFLFCILWLLRKNKRQEGFLFGLYLTGYGVVRLCIEFVREPDAHIGFLWGGLTLGQILCGLMIIAGIGVMWRKKAMSHEP